MDGSRPGVANSWSNGINGPAVTNLGQAWDQPGGGRGRGFAPGRGRGFAKWAQVEEKTVGLTRSQDNGTNGWSIGDRSNGIENSDKNCFRCKATGHLSRECPNGESKSYVRSPDCQISESWGSPLGPHGGSQRNKITSSCYNCGGGHISKDCSAQTGRRNGGKVHGAGETCYKCGERGHFARECKGDYKRQSDRGGAVSKSEEQYVPEESLEENLYEHGVVCGNNFMAYENIPVNVTGLHCPSKIDSFGMMGLDDRVMSNIQKSKYRKPTPVQKYAIPMILANRDVMGCAQTGSGKTAAFLIPIIQKLLQTNVCNTGKCRPACPEVVIMTPTRELAKQIKDEARKFCSGSDLRCVVAYGGTSSVHQTGLLDQGCNILVATPGRLHDLVEKGNISYSQVRYFVLDEADRMLDMGFKGDIVKIVGNHEMPGKETRRTIMFSATFPDEIQELAFDFLSKDYLFLGIGHIGGACKDVEQIFEQVAQYEKREKLLNILKTRKEENNGIMPKSLVFVETKKNADFLASYMCQLNLAATSIHGDRLQREREEALKDFKRGNKPVLVATAVAARGLDIQGVEHVVNYDLPSDIAEYVHRIGRTGRVGNTGRATSFYDSGKDHMLAAALLNVLAEAQQTVPNWLEAEARRHPEGHHGTNHNNRFSSRDIRMSGPGFVPPGQPLEEDEGWD